MKLPELEELYRRYRMDLYRYLCFLTHDPVQAEDLLSETFVRVIKRLPTFRGECEVKTWLFGIARNIWLESLRRRHQSVSLDDLMERYITDDALTETTAARQKLRRVQALLRKRTSRHPQRGIPAGAGVFVPGNCPKTANNRSIRAGGGAPYPRLAESNPAKGGIRRMTQEKETNRQAEQGKAETEIPCAVCRDLIPLVQDGVASPESEALVKAHLQTCPECRTLWQADGGRALPQSLPAPDDARLLQKIRHKYNTGLLMFAALGMGFGGADKLRRTFQLDHPDFPVCVCCGRVSGPPDVEAADGSGGGHCPLRAAADLRALLAVWGHPGGVPGHPNCVQRFYAGPVRRWLPDWLAAELCQRERREKT